MGTPRPDGSARHGASDGGKYWRELSQPQGRRGFRGRRAARLICFSQGSPPEAGGREQRARVSSRRLRERFFSLCPYTSRKMMRSPRRLGPRGRFALLVNTTGAS